METKTKRIYLRCRDCLSVSAVDVSTERTGAGFLVAPLPRGLACVCGGKVESMGEVRGSRLVKTTLEAPCDARCTNARGPSCDCPCHGANHGSGVLIEIAVDAGGVPRVRSADPAKAAEFHAACEAAKARFRLKYGRDLAGGDWLSDEAYYEKRRYLKAKKVRVHKTRLARLAEVVASVKLEDAA